MLSIMVSLLMFTAFVVCLAGGILSLVLASQKRHHKGLYDYLDSVESWTEHRKSFAEIPRLTLRASAPTSTRSPQSIGTPSQGQVNVSDHLVLLPHDKLDPTLPKEPALPTYQALTYRVGQRSGRLNARGGGHKDDSLGNNGQDEPPHSRDFLPEVGFDSMRTESPVLKAGSFVEFTFYMGSSSFKLEPIPLVKAEGHYEPAGMYNHCHARHGLQAQNELCWVHWRLTGLCVQISSSPNGTWHLQPRDEKRVTSYGCTYANGAWLAPEYSLVPSVHHESATWEELSSSSATFQDFGAEVRSSDDPYLLALELTDGKLVFGWTEAEEDLLGIVLIIMALVIAFQPAMRCYQSCRKHRQMGKARNARHRYITSAKPIRRRQDLTPETVGMRYARGDDHPEQV